MVALALDQTDDITSRDLAPFETTICERLTDEIRQFIRGEEERYQPLHSPSACSFRSLDVAIRHVATTIRYNAKWFEPNGLATLLLACLQAVTLSSSSADIHAALVLIDTVGIYSLLGPSVMLPVTRFLSYAYYQGTRAHRLKRLTRSAWSVSLHILQMGYKEQFIAAFAHILREDLDLFDHRTGFAYTMGALMIVTDEILPREGEVPEVKLTYLVYTLKSTAKSRDDLIREYITRIINRILDDDKKMKSLGQDAAYDTLICVIERLVDTCPSHADSHEILRRLDKWICKFEWRLLENTAWLFVRCNRPLTSTLQRAVFDGWQKALLIDPLLTEAQERAMEGLCKSGLYLYELGHVVEKSLQFFIMTEDSATLDSVLGRLIRIVSKSTTVPAAALVMGEELVRAFKNCLQLLVPYWKRAMLFETMCSIADRSPDAAKMLFRLRSDVRGSLYFAAGPAESVSHNGIKTAMSVYDSWPLPVGRWHEVIAAVVGGGAVTWEAYDCFLTRLPGVLSNHKMFDGKLDLIKRLLSTVCGHLENGSYQHPPAATGLSRYYVVTHLIRILTTMTSYHRRLEKQEILRVVSLFNASAGSGDHVVSKNCIHAIAVCCAEIPDIMSSYMDDVVDKMSKMVTQRFLAIHVLQFFAGLSRLPALHRNFIQHDYKKIFAVCFSYLQSTGGSKTTAIERKPTPNSEGSSTTHVEEALPEYVYALAHHLITFWYMSLMQQDREGLKPYITSGLVHTDNSGNETIEEQGVVTIDMMDRVDAECDYGGDWPPDDDQGSVGAVMPSFNPFASVDGRLAERHVLAGLLLIAIKTSYRTGKSLVTVRRPSGTSQRVVDGKERAKVTVDSDVASYIPATPHDPQGCVYGLISIPKHSSFLAYGKSIELPENDAVRRAIEFIDRTSALDSHKAGVLYIGERQVTEDRIFHNISGSPDYREFLSDLGTLEQLKGATFNTQGLDKADNMDGTHTYVWHTRVMEMVFHITTMMPNHEDPRQNTAMKKRHIGNDHVNIVFNNSGTHLDFGALYSLFPGQFTHVYIVITPSARTSFVEARTENINVDKRDRFYGVQVVARPDYPNISPAAEEKMVSGASLAGFVRNLALNECIISLMWTSRNESTEYPSSWRSRLHQIRRLRERYGQK
ncbi:hypothetical protein Tdes44962_MAKER01273 [Teratosphaeria destructans]|uniref:Rap-GAP domain-containing protein n=1 Tax=Teratosphaeria destructans TaxID=418781 RepID=A0A9W7T107_9PEZI|nr:hypothetical protein Tdes44962_MAKER01273 [Teratosphaeria destructans]